MIPTITTQHSDDATVRAVATHPTEEIGYGTVTVARPESDAFERNAVVITLPDGSGVRVLDVHGRALAVALTEHYATLDAT